MITNFETYSFLESATLKDFENEPVFSGFIYPLLANEDIAISHRCHMFKVFLAWRWQKIKNTPLNYTLAPLLPFNKFLIAFCNDLYLHGMIDSSVCEWLMPSVVTVILALDEEGTIAEKTRSIRKNIFIPQRFCFLDVACTRLLSLEDLLEYCAGDPALIFGPPSQFATEFTKLTSREWERVFATSDFIQEYLTARRLHYLKISCHEFSHDSSVGMLLWEIAAAMRAASIDGSKAATEHVIDPEARLNKLIPLIFTWYRRLPQAIVYRMGSMMAMHADVRLHYRKPISLMAILIMLFNSDPHISMLLTDEERHIAHGLITCMAVRSRDIEQILSKEEYSWLFATKLGEIPVECKYDRHDINELLASLDVNKLHHQNVEIDQNILDFIGFMYKEHDLDSQLLLQVLLDNFVDLMQINGVTWGYLCMDYLTTMDRDQFKIAFFNSACLSPLDMLKISFDRDDPVVKNSQPASNLIHILDVMLFNEHNHARRRLIIDILASKLSSRMDAYNIFSSLHEGLTIEQQDLLSAEVIEDIEHGGELYRTLDCHEPTSWERFFRCRRRTSALIALQKTIEESKLMDAPVEERQIG